MLLLVRFDMAHKVLGSSHDTVKLLLDIADILVVYLKLLIHLADLRFALRERRGQLVDRHLALF